ncbi:3-isopropylmalate dehydratase large subunit [Mycolicibacterium agri]|uniref:3-isopropylmalate dehydratase large subunit n=2 Tax=Mycolicibacterium agri TaxID=36811 RepID=A0A2A7N9R3_MYCAG|nr:aconitase/3-isopropylmalate dehydratase large subunit family protein [Mycolicibacterium agri]PEG40634.1 3-isopropylmalate dehydratase large subunit [Mycolicibacterium agri]
MGSTIAEKIFSKHVGHPVSAGDIVISPVDFVFSHDGNRPQPLETFAELGGDRVFDPSCVAMFLDHAPQVHTPPVAALHQQMRAFAADQGIHLYEIGRGISHQVLPEEGHAVPGRVIVGSDSHTCTAGAFNLLATGVGSTDLATAMMLGKLWFKVPETIRIVCEGPLAPGVYAKDLVLELLRLLGADGATYKSLEFVGSTFESLDMHGRMTLTNMGVEMGAKFAIMPADEVLARHLADLGVRDYPVTASDPDATFSATISVDAAMLEPLVAEPPNPDRVRPVSEVAGRPIQQATIGTSTNGQLDDLRAAVAVLGDNKIAPSVRLFVAPASRRAYLDALQEGLIARLIEAGAIIGTSGCSGCTGASGFAVPGDDTTMITSAPRNFVGRTGNRNADIFLASPATVMASAIEGVIADPRRHLTSAATPVGAAS